MGGSFSTSSINNGGSFTNATLVNPTITVLDNKLSIQDNADPTKQFQFDAALIATASVRIISVLDRNYTLADNADVTSVSAALVAHITDVSNPHATTKAQVGLGNVANVDTTNAANISSGILPTARLNTTGSGSTFALSAGPTFTGTANAASLALTGLLNISSGTAGQISFPATQNPSAGANVLDDYEEGTFTVTATCSVSGTLTLDLSTLGYTKIGRNVNIYGILRISAISAPNGIMFINGIPFTIADWSGIGLYGNGLAATAVTCLQAYFEATTTRMAFFKFSAGSNTGLANDAAVNATFILNGAYPT